MHDYMIYVKTRFYFRSPSTDTALDREEVLDALKELHIGEWEKYYDPMRFGYCVMDGTQWSVTFGYSNGKDALEISGNNRRLNVSGVVILFKHRLNKLCRSSSPLCCNNCSLESILFM